MSAVNTNQQQPKHLSEDVNEALRQLVTLSNRLLDYTDQETQTLIKNDHMNFAFIQRDKERIAYRYAGACAEFHGRLDEFRSADKGLILQLDKLQNALKEKTVNNNKMVAQLRDHSQSNTQATLFSAQEMAQRAHVRRPTILKQANTEQEKSS